MLMLTMLNDNDIWPNSKDPLFGTALVFCDCGRIASIKQKLGQHKESLELYNAIRLQSADYVPALQGYFLGLIECA